MPPAPSPDPDPDAPEPAGSGSQPVPAGGNGGAPEPPQAPEPKWSDEEDGADYLEELMAAAAAGEELTAGDISGAGFGQDGTADQMHPGPVLATLVHAATTDEKILATLSDDDLIGVIAAVRRIGSFAAWAELTAVREYATRPDPLRPATPVPLPVPPPVRLPVRLPVRPPVRPLAAAALPGASVAGIPTRRSRACRAGRRCGSSRPRSWPWTCT